MTTETTSGGNELSPLHWHSSSYSNGSGGNCVEVATRWRKSSYSNGSGGDCVEVAGPWRKSSYSNGDGGDCVEVADGHPALIPVRDSKRSHSGPVLLFTPHAWAAFIHSYQAD